MSNAPQPELLFSIDQVPDSDITELDSNYGDTTNAIPSDIQLRLSNSGHPLSGAQTVDILAAGSSWLITDNQSYYNVKYINDKLFVYLITADQAQVLLTSARTASGVAALNIVTAACHAILNTGFTAPDPKPDWFDDLNAKLDVAKVLAKEWVDDIQPELTASLPNEVINYGTTYNAVTDQIVKIADANPTAQGKDNPHVQNVFDLISALKTQVGKVHDDLEAEDGKLATWGDKMQQAHDDLFNGVANIQKAETDLVADIGAMNSAIDGLKAQIAGENQAIAAAGAAIGIGLLLLVVGIALAAETGGASLIVAGIGGAGVVGGAVTWGVMQDKINKQFKKIAEDQNRISADKQQIVALQGLSLAANQAVSSIALATSALSAVKAMWKLFEGELQGTLDKLNLAEEDLSLIVNEAFVNGAQAEWQLAEQLAQQLVSTPAQSQSQTLPMAA
jgi:hypothetical protein